MEEFMTNTFIFDLDGTLLPMPDQELFTRYYFKAISKKLAAHDIDPEHLIKAIWAGTEAMIRNDGTMTNEERFWNVFSGLMGSKSRELETVFNHFYRNEFEEAKLATSVNPNAAECIRLLRSKGYLVILATNPIFPRVATLARIGWAGLDPEDFGLITTYENSSYCKPNLKYYEEVLDHIGRIPEECIMIGNDVKEDMCASRLGMDTYLLKECLINSEGEDISCYKQGDFNDLLEVIKAYPQLC